MKKSRIKKYRTFVFLFSLLTVLLLIIVVN